MICFLLPLQCFVDVVIDVLGDIVGLDVLDVVIGGSEDIVDIDVIGVDTPMSEYWDCIKYEGNVNSKEYC